MRNKYMRRGVWCLGIGVALVLLGYYLRDNELMKYGWAMILGTALFGIGFLLIIYSLIRKIERNSILEERAAAHEEENQEKDKNA